MTPAFSSASYSDAASPGGIRSVTWDLLRIGTGLLFMQHGAQKLLGWFGGMDGAGATASLFTQMGLAGILELVGGLLLVIGLLTRIVAVVLLLEMIVAYVMVHQPLGLAPIANQGELALLYALIFAFFAAHGAGPFSLDQRRGRPAAARPAASPIETPVEPAPMPRQE